MPMARGGRQKERDGPERRCIATGESGPKEGLIRFVLGPGGEVVPDIAEKLPGRGVWLTADPALVEKAVRKRLFSRAFRAEARPPEGLAATLERLLAERLVAAVSMARKAGAAVTGFEKVRARLKQGPVGALLAATDGAEDGRAKLARAAGDAPLIEVLDAGELGLAFGREFAIHAALDPGRIAERAVRDAHRLAAFRAPQGARGGVTASGGGATAPAEPGEAVSRAEMSGK